MILKTSNELQKRIKADKIIFKIFISLIAITLIFSFIGAILSKNSIILEFINNVFNGISIIFLLTGFISAYYYWKRGITKFRRIIIYTVILAIVLSFGPIIYLKYVHNDITTRLLSMIVDNEILALITLHISLSLGLIIACFFIVIMGFGAVGVMSAFMRINSHEIFEDIQNISRYTEEYIKEKDYFKYLHHKILRWFFSIPYVLDTKRFEVEYPKLKESFSKNKYKTAILWELFFGIIISVNISLNPFLLEYLSLSELFALTSGIAIFIPIIILPWFVYDDLNAKITGPYKDFSLYEGLKNRVFEILVTVGTLYTFIRLAIRDISLHSLFINFVTYLSGVILLILLFTYVYFNYFERDLVLDIYNRYKGNE